MNKKISRMGVAALMAATAFGSCASQKNTQKNTQDDGNRQAIRFDDNMDAGYLILSDDQRAAVA